MDQLKNEAYTTARNRIRSAMLDGMYTMEDIETEVALRNAFDRIAVKMCDEADRLGVSPAYLEKEIDYSEDYYAVDAELRELAAKKDGKEQHQPQKAGNSRLTTWLCSVTKMPRWKPQRD